jgi:hypothetical protein
MHVALTALFLVFAHASVTSAQSAGTALGDVYPSLDLRVASLHVQSVELSSAERQAIRDNKPSIVAPLVITVAGFSVGVGALAIGLLSTIGDCASANTMGTPPPGSQPSAAPVSDARDACDRSIDTPFAVTVAVAGGIGLLGSIWLAERLIARGAYNREQRDAAARNHSTLRVLPTLGGAALLGRF